MTASREDVRMPCQSYFICVSCECPAAVLQLTHSLTLPLSSSHLALSQQILLVHTHSFPRPCISYHVSGWSEASRRKREEEEGSL